MLYGNGLKWWGDRWKDSLVSSFFIFVTGTRDHGSRESGKRAMGALTHGPFIS